ncbi:hypothetical protein ENSA5_69130 [Enhygromyxa salina]|uniref:Uncharacterized protein n=1 Tax=Enhygromyxa salina TaxID=215803 RepID=A0A2S9XAT6_9BACT|nr:hypothetical protein [Enhygromyxa salina]PRP89972.1 hypothetical protein ENSA5_69130 [Enhygromyxa salina]
MSDDNKPQWRWRRSPWWGPMYGPIPVGFIFTIVVLATFMIVGCSREW